jgi:parallel beta-helix repeat protein
MRKSLLIAMSTVLTVWLFSLPAIAQPNISGPLSGTLGPGTYIVNGDCYVQNGESLTIAPATAFLHSGHYAWYISGELQAIGTQEQPISFVRQQPIEAHKWGGLRFDATASPSSTLEWCEFEYCKNVVSPITRGGAIYLDHVGITILNCTITYCQAEYGGGIYTSYADSVVIDNCTFANNTAELGGGVHLVDTQGATLTNCIIRNNTSNGC